MEEIILARISFMKCPFATSLVPPDTASVHREIQAVPTRPWTPELAPRVTWRLVLRHLQNGQPLCLTVRKVRFVLRE